VKKTGLAKVHAGEVVLTKKSVSHLKKVLKWSRTYNKRRAGSQPCLP
jgi:hypothetical protein